MDDQSDHEDEPVAPLERKKQKRQYTMTEPRRLAFERMTAARAKYIEQKVAALGQKSEQSVDKNVAPKIDKNVAPKVDKDVAQSGPDAAPILEKTVAPKKKVVKEIVEESESSESEPEIVIVRKKKKNKRKAKVIIEESDSESSDDEPIVVKKKKKEKVVEPKKKTSILETKPVVAKEPEAEDYSRWFV